MSRASGEQAVKDAPLVVIRRYLARSLLTAAALVLATVSCATNTATLGQSAIPGPMSDDLTIRDPVHDDAPPRAVPKRGSVNIPVALAGIVGLLLTASFVGRFNMFVDPDPVEVAQEVEGGDAGRGETAIREYGCGACHSVPGVAGANGTVAPPLNSFAERDFIAGARRNTPEELILWIQNPQAIEPGTAMPDVGVSEEDARDIAAYLYTLR